jgi:hypothetical protein
MRIVEEFRMSLDRMISPLVAITLMELMAATGLSVRFADVMGAASDWRLVARAGLANYVAVPATAVLLLLLLDADPMVSAGFLILAVCPGAPYGPPLTAIAGGTTAISVGLMVILAGTSVFVAPAVLLLLLPFMSDGGELHVDAIGMLGVMLATQLLPLCCGLAVNQWRPDLATRLLRPAIAVSKVLNAATLAVIFASQLPRLLDVRPIGAWHAGPDGCQPFGWVVLRWGAGRRSPRRGAHNRDPQCWTWHRGHGRRLCRDVGRHGLGLRSHTTARVVLDRPLVAAKVIAGGSSVS